MIRAVGVETGGSNVQFAVNPETDEIVVIEMNPRVSRSSALASKATGFPIAKIAARLAVGYTLQEIPNDITRATPASFEPAIDYCVVKWPRFAFEKFPGAEAGLTTHMKSVGEAMAIGRTFKQAFAKALRSRELDTPRRARRRTTRRCSSCVGEPGAERFDQLLEALRRGIAVEELHRRTSIDPWFLHELAELVRRARGAVRRASARSSRSTPARPSSRPRRRTTTRRWERRGPRRPRATRSRRGERAERRDPRLGAQPDRPGHRVRLLLRARRADRARARAATR